MSINSKIFTILQILFIFNVIFKMSLSIEDEEFFEDENIWERIIGLTEMFPESVRSLTSKSASKSWKVMKKSYTFFRNAGWILASVLVVGAGPAVFESLRDKALAEDADQQRKLMFGPQSEGGFSIPPTIRAN